MRESVFVQIVVYFLRLPLVRSEISKLVKKTPNKIDDIVWQVICAWVDAYPIKKA